MMPDSAQELAVYAAAWLTAAFVVACVLGHVLRRISDRWDVPRWMEDEVELTPVVEEAAAA